jgi:hypothetical protein
MTENVSKLNQKARLAYIEAHLLFETQAEMAVACKVDRRTIERDIVKWKQGGGFDRFLEREFFQLYGKEKLQNPSRALDRIVTLMIKRISETEQVTSQPKISNPVNELIEISRVEPCSNNSEQSPS